MALILKAKTKRDGSIKRFDVLAAVPADSTVKASFKDAKAGTYHVHTDDGRLITAKVAYREVQDIDLQG